MNIDLTNSEVRKILVDKFGEANFRVFYIESDKLWEARNNKTIADMDKAPEKENYVLYFQG